MIEVEFDEGKRLLDRTVCGECGGELSLAWGGSLGVEGYVLRCSSDPEHHSIKSREEFRHLMRRQPAESQVPALLRSHPMETLKALVIARFPRAEMNDASADVFILDCLRLDLDPLLGEIVPVTFKDRKTGRSVVTPVLTEDGWLAMAARGCPNEWMGPPTTEPVTDEAFREALLGPEGKDAWVWRAAGKVRRHGEAVETSAYGWLKRKEWEKSRADGTPAGELPGNQARVRAIKRWVRENFSEARARMKEMTAGWLERAEGVEEARQAIDAEYRVVGELPAGNGQGQKDAPAPGQQVHMASDAQVRHIAHLAKERGIGREELHRMAGREHLKDLTMKEASEFIDRLKAEPKRQPELVPQEEK